MMLFLISFVSRVFSMIAAQLANMFAQILVMAFTPGKPA